MKSRKPFVIWKHLPPPAIRSESNIRPDLPTTSLVRPANTINLNARKPAFVRQGFKLRSSDTKPRMKCFTLLEQTVLETLNSLIPADILNQALKGELCKRMAAA